VDWAIAPVEITAAAADSSNSFFMSISLPAECGAA